MHMKIDEKTLVRKLHSAIANMVLSFDDITEVNMNLQEQIMNYGQVLEDQKQIFESIQLQDVEAVLKELKFKEMAVVVLKNNI